MRRSFLAAVAGLALALSAGPARAADLPYAGNWKVTVLEGAQAVTVWVVRLDKDGKTVEVLDQQAQFKESSKAGKLTGGDKEVRFSITANVSREGRGNTVEFHLSAFPPKGKEKASTLLGAIAFARGASPLRLERTEEKKLPKDASEPLEGGEEVKKVLKKDKPEEQLKELKALAEKYAGKPIGYATAQVYLQRLLVSEAGADELKSAAQRYVKEAAPYGPDLEQYSLATASQALALNDKAPAQALEYARRAVKLIRDDEPPAKQHALLSLLATQLKKAGKADELKEVTARIAKLDEALDREYEKTAFPFAVEPAKKREGKGERVAVVELFTGAQCPPCVAADIAFDAAIKAYPPKDAVFLEYHLHIPGPDPLTNADTEARQEYYGEKMIPGTPAAIIDGAVSEEALGGFRQHAKERYDALRKMINDEMGKEAEASVKLSVERKGDKIDIKADVDGLKAPGEKVKLRLVLIEDVVRYQGRNGQRLHHHVVRAMPGGAEGFKLDKKSSTHSASVDVGEVRKKLEQYLTEHAKKSRFVDDERPLELKKLKVVALVQDDGSKKILQAAQVDVPEGK